MRRFVNRIPVTPAAEVTEPLETELKCGLPAVFRLPLIAKLRALRIAVTISLMPAVFTTYPRSAKILQAGMSACSLRVAAIPLRTGILMSIITISGASSLASRITRLGDNRYVALRFQTRA